MTILNDTVMSREALLAELHALRAWLAALTLGKARQDSDVHHMALPTTADVHVAPAQATIREIFIASRDGACGIQPRRDPADGLREILAIVNSTHSVDDSLHQILVLAARLLSANAGAIYRLHEPEQILRIRAAHGLAAEATVVNVPVNSGPIGRAITQRRPVAAALDVAYFPDLSASRAESEQPAGWAALAQRYATVLAVPLIIRDEVYGAIALYQHAAHTFSDTEIQLALAIGDYAALAVENARLFAAAHDTAALEERQRLARELHDSVSQALYVVKLYAEAAGRRVAAGDTATAMAHLRELRSAAQEALQEMRLLIFELRPPILEQEGLASAIQARLDGVEGRAGLQTRLTVEGEHCPTAMVGQALYRIAQEALNNALKHAHAHQISVLLQQEPQSTVLMVVDDGIGFEPPAAAASGGLGFRGMKERVALLGGRLTVESTPGMGTVIRAEVGS